MTHISVYSTAYQAAKTMADDDFILQASFGTCSQMHTIYITLDLKAFTFAGHGAIIVNITIFIHSNLTGPFQNTVIGDPI